MPERAVETEPAASHKSDARKSGGSLALRDNRPNVIAQPGLADALRNSPYVAAQRRQLRGMFGDSVVQGYFTIDTQKTNDAGIFPESVTEDDDKKEYIWVNIVKGALEKKHISAELIAEVKEKAMTLAMDARKFNFDEFVGKIEALQDRRTKRAGPLSERASPASLPPLLSGTPELGDKEKHSTAKYKRTGPTEETFSSDDYTKGPAKRRREELDPTTPSGLEVQNWTRAGVKTAISEWNCKTPLARYLAGHVWPLIQNSDEGKKWELKFREIDRLIAFRDTEAQSSTITIVKRSNKETVKTLERSAYTFRARQLLKAALINGDKHPADQQKVLFYDELLKEDVDEALQIEDSEVFDLKPAYEAAGPGLSMLLTHWRPIVFFDWILAEDVMNNGT
jgi:hypothetical protein